jgi:hypothetical protein
MARKRLPQKAAHRAEIKLRATPALRKEIARAAREQRQHTAVVVRNVLLEWACERKFARERQSNEVVI